MFFLFVSVSMFLIVLQTNGQTMVPKQWKTVATRCNNIYFFFYMRPQALFDLVKFVCLFDLFVWLFVSLFCVPFLYFSKFSTVFYPELGTKTISKCGNTLWQQVFSSFTWGRRRFSTWWNLRVFVFPCKLAWSNTVVGKIAFVSGVLASVFYQAYW